MIWENIQAAIGQIPGVLWVGIIAVVAWCVLAVVCAVVEKVQENRRGPSRPRQ